MELAREVTLLIADKDARTRLQPTWCITTPRGTCPRGRGASKVPVRDYKVRTYWTWKRVSYLKYAANNGIASGGSQKGPTMTGLWPFATIARSR